MKKLTGSISKMVLVFCMSAMVMGNGSIYAGNRTSIKINEEMIDASPIIEKGTTLVPLRIISEKLGATVGWSEAERKVTVKKDINNITLYIDDSVANVNGELINLQLPAKIVESRTMVPLRFISENLNCNVDYNANSKLISITSKDGKPLVSEVNVAKSTDGLGHNTRNTNLPRNANKFVCVREDIPNWCYELQENAYRNNLWGRSHLENSEHDANDNYKVYLNPKEVASQVAGTRNQVLANRETLEKTLNTMINFDYRTIDNEQYLKDYYAGINITGKNNFDLRKDPDTIAMSDKFLAGVKRCGVISKGTATPMYEAMWMDVDHQVASINLPIRIQVSQHYDKWDVKREYNDVYTFIGFTSWHMSKTNKNYGTHCKSTPEDTKLDAVVTLQVCYDKIQGKMNFSPNFTNIIPQIVPNVNSMGGVNPDLNPEKNTNKYIYWWCASENDEIGLYETYKGQIKTIYD